MHNSNDELQPENLVKFFEQGLIVAPDEDEKSFLERVRIYEKLPAIPFKNSRFKISSAYTQYEKKRPILPWFAAITEFSYENEIPIPKIKIHCNAPDEVIDHELIHAVRAPFPESVFEEFLAFESSKGLRKTLGPLFFHAYEANLCMIGICIAFFWPPLLILPLLYLLFLGVRLKKTSSIYKKALEEICVTFSTTNPLPFALFLTTKEFNAFALGDRNLFLNRPTTTNSLRFLQFHSWVQATQSIKNPSP